MTLPLKSYILPDDRVSIVCPNCGFSKLIPISELPTNHSMVKIGCNCNHSFTVQVETRKSFRKETALEGVFKLGGTPKVNLMVTVVNLSIGGVGLEVHKIHGLTVGDKGIIKFSLDDRKKTVMERQIVVRSISDNQIRCEFKEDSAFEKELGFYLWP